MNSKQYRQSRIVVVFLVSILVALASKLDLAILAIAAALTGFVFLLVVRFKHKIVIDEREKTIREKAAQTAQAVFTPTLAIGALLMILFGQNSIYILALGQIFAYLSLFQMLLYAISFHFYNHKYGAAANEE